MFDAYEKGEWGGDVVGAWGALILVFTRTNIGIKM